VPKTSVIIPAYNAEKTILETVRSVQDQSSSDLEIIVIDDGSTDQTLHLLQELKDSRMQIFSFKNCERSVARNRGIKIASGDYITFIDADDLWTHDKIELQIKALESNPKAGVAYSWTSFINETGNFLFSAKPYSFEGDVYSKILVNNFTICGSNILVRKNIIKAVGEFDPLLNIGEDWDLNIRLAEQCHYVVVPKYQILYRRSSESTSCKVDAMATGTIAVINKAFKSAPPELQYLKNRALSDAYRFISLLYTEHLISNNETNEAIQSLKKALRHYPMIILEKETQRLILKLALLKIFPIKLILYINQFFSKRRLLMAGNSYK
jgi:glycosyltransferase involved in cell wall biosynthesis